MGLGSSYSVVAVAAIAVCWLACLPSSSSSSSSSSSAAAAINPPATAFQYQRFLETDSPGNDLTTSVACTNEDCCQQLCDDDLECSGYVWAYNLPPESPYVRYCWLKQHAINPVPLAQGSTWATTGLMVAVRGQTSPLSYVLFVDFDSVGHDLLTVPPDPSGCSERLCCARLCDENAGCMAFVWAEAPSNADFQHYCWLKSGANPQLLSAGHPWSTKGLMVGVKGTEAIHGNNGTTSCRLHCEAQGRSCISAFDTRGREQTHCYAVRGAALPEVTCNCFTLAVDCGSLIPGCLECSANQGGTWLCDKCNNTGFGGGGDGGHMAQSLLARSQISSCGFNGSADRVVIRASVEVPNLCLTRCASEACQPQGYQTKSTTNVVALPCSGSAADNNEALWLFSAGQGLIRSATSPAHCLAVTETPGSNTISNVLVLPCDQHSPMQQWKHDPQDGSLKVSGSLGCLDICVATSSLGCLLHAASIRNVIIYYQCHKQYNQVFSIVKSEGAHVCGLPNLLDVAACGMYGACVEGACVCTHGFSGTFCEIPPAGTPYTECRQVQSKAGAVVYSRPCAAGTRKPDVAFCSRVEFVVPPTDVSSPVFHCPNNSCWMEILVAGVRGNWLRVSEACSAESTSEVVVADCPAAACPAVAPPGSNCRQVGTPEDLALRVAPCMSAERVPNTIDLARGVMVSYTNTHSKQTSRCGRPPDAGTRPLCWVSVNVSQGGEAYTGFVPVARVWKGQPGFNDAFCAGAADVPQEPLLLDKCATESYVECRQVTKTDGLPVHTAPCATSPLVTPLYTVSKCERVEFAQGYKSASVCGDNYSWVLVRYRESAASPYLQWGWVQAGEPSANSSYMSFCPATKECPQAKVCRQVIDQQDVTLRAAPCWSSRALAMLKTWATVQYYGSFSKQSSRCPPNSNGEYGYDGLCWVKADALAKNGRLITGWLPAGRALGNLQDAFCGAISPVSGVGVVTSSILRSYCDLCVKRICPGPPVSLRWNAGCWRTGRCDPPTGTCSPAVPLPKGQPCTAVVAGIGVAGSCNGAGRCTENANSLTLLEAEDQYLSKEMQDLLRDWNTILPAMGPYSSEQADLMSDVNAMRLDNCPDYPEGSSRGKWCEDIAAQYFDSTDDLSASYDAEDFTPPPFCSNPGQCDHSGCHIESQSDCTSFPVPSFSSPASELHNTTGMTDEDWEEVLYWGRQAVSLGAGFLPVVGEIKDIQEALTGIDLITGEQLSPLDQVLTAAGVLLPFVPGKALRAAKKAMTGISMLEVEDELHASSLPFPAAKKFTFKFKDRLKSAKTHAEGAAKADNAPKAGDKIFKRDPSTKIRADVSKAQSLGLTIDHVGDVVVRLGRTYITLKDGTRKSLWALDHFARGFAFERVLIKRGQHLGRNFPVFDTFADGKLISLKTLNTASNTYQDAKKLKAVLEAYIRKTVDFELSKHMKGGKLSRLDRKTGIRTEVRANGDVVAVAASGTERVLTNYRPGGVATKELHIVIPPNMLDQARADIFSSHLAAFANEWAKASGGAVQQLFIKIIIAG